nr:MAG TPA: hypothetical protein [Caudoviricetes sp.]
MICWRKHAASWLVKASLFRRRKGEAWINYFMRALPARESGSLPPLLSRGSRSTLARWR